MQKPDTWTCKLVEQEPVVDLTKCYFCGERAKAKCATCRIPMCDDHQRETWRHGDFCGAITIMCFECEISMRNW